MRYNIYIHIYHIYTNIIRHIYTIQYIYLNLPQENFQYKYYLIYNLMYFSYFIIYYNIEYIKGKIHNIFLVRNLFSLWFTFYKGIYYLLILILINIIIFYNIITWKYVVVHILYIIDITHLYLLIICMTECFLMKCSLSKYFLIN